MALIQKYEEYLAEINRCIDENDLDKKRLSEAHSRIVRKIIVLRMAKNKADGENKREDASRSFASEDSAFVIV
jgi:hypothetical protein